jgi:hypothetical protein
MMTKQYGYTNILIYPVLQLLYNITRVLSNQNFVPAPIMPLSSVNGFLQLSHLIFVDDLEVNGLAGHEGEGVVETDLVITNFLIKWGMICTSSRSLFKCGNRNNSKARPKNPSRVGRIRTVPYIFIRIFQGVR